MNFFKKYLLLILLSYNSLSYAGAYEPFMGHSLVITPYQCYFNGFMAGVGYSIIDGTFRSNSTIIFDPTNPPPLRQEKDAHLDAVDVYVGYGQQVSRLLYLGIRGGAQLYTKSNVDLLRPAPRSTNITLEDKYRARQTGFIDFLPGLVLEDRFMIYPFVGFSNTKYVFQGSVLEQGEPPFEYRNEKKWGKAYRFGIGAKYAFFKAVSMDIHVLHQAPYHVTWPATGAVSLDDPTASLDPVKHRLQPYTNMLTIAFEGYIN